MNSSQRHIRTKLDPNKPSKGPPEINYEGKSLVAEQRSGVPRYELHGAQLDELPDMYVARKRRILLALAVSLL
jgi:hypothetical protein